MTLGQNAMSDEVVALAAQLESMSGAKLAIGYPVTTRRGGWRITLHRGEVGLRSWSFGPGMTLAEALSNALSVYGHERELRDA